MLNKTRDRQEMEARLNALLQLLDNSDKDSNRASEGDPSSRWEEIKEQRRLWRREASELEDALEEMEEPYEN